MHSLTISRSESARRQEGLVLDNLGVLLACRGHASQQISRDFNFAPVHLVASATLLATICCTLYISYNSLAPLHDLVPRSITSGSRSLAIRSSLQPATCSSEHCRRSGRARQRSNDQHRRSALLLRERSVLETKPPQPILCIQCPASKRSRLYSRPANARFIRHPTYRRIQSHRS